MNNPSNHGSPGGGGGRRRRRRRGGSGGGGNGGGFGGGGGGGGGPRDAQGPPRDHDDYDNGNGNADAGDDGQGGDDTAPAGDAGDGATVSGGAAMAGTAAGEPSLVVPPDKTVVLGITGEPGAGKSALARELVKLGATVIDADLVGHDTIESPLVKKRLVKEFGAEIVGEDGGIDRRKLGAKAFATAESVAALNTIVHTKLATNLKAALKKAGNFVVIDAALLHELGMGESCNQAIYVRAPRDARLLRVGERGWDEAELGRREAALGDADARRRACQLTVDNSGDPALLAAYAKTILARQLGIDLVALRRQQATAVRRATEPASGGNDDDEDDDDHRDSVVAAPPATTVPPVGLRPGFEPRQLQPDGQQRRDAPNGQGWQQGQGGQGGQGQGQGNQPPYDSNRPPVKIELNAYLRRTLPDLQGEADKYDVRDVKWLKKHDLICEIFKRNAAGRLDELVIEGFMELVKDQHAYIRSQLNGYLPVATDTFVTGQQIRRFGLKPGMHVTGTARAPRGQERCPQLLSIHTVMGEPENKRTAVQDFESLTPLHAFERLFMELPNDPTDYTLRIFDLVAPIGKGQRGLIVAQPKCGKTVYLQKIAKAISINNPEVVLMVLLVDERPEEVTDMQRSVKGEVVSSTFDQHSSRHVQCAEMVINKAKRLVERGKDVVILLDSITRLARAYNTEAPGSGRVMSGGIESGALIKPKQFFGAARKIEDGGSLTILATAIVDTGSLADTVIFEEFKGTGNMELVLDRRLSNRRVFPAVDPAASGTRKDELLIKNDDELRRLWALKKFLADRNAADAIEFLRSKLKNYKTNVEFLLSIDPEKMSGW